MTPIYTSSEKRQLISYRMKGLLVAAFRSPPMKALDRRVETLGLWIVTSSVTLIKSVNQSSIKPCQQRLSCKIHWTSKIYQWMITNHNAKIIMKLQIYFVTKLLVEIIRSVNEMHFIALTSAVKKLLLWQVDVFRTLLLGWRSRRFQQQKQNRSTSISSLNSLSPQRCWSK